MKKTKWVDLPEKKFELWMADYIVAGLVLRFYSKHKRFPKKLNPNTFIKTKKDGSGILTAEMA